MMIRGGGQSEQTTAMYAPTRSTSTVIVCQLIVKRLTAWLAACLTVWLSECLASWQAGKLVRCMSNQSASQRVSQSGQPVGRRRMRPGSCIIHCVAVYSDLWLRLCCRLAGFKVLHATRFQVIHSSISVRDYTHTHSHWSVHTQILTFWSPKRICRRALRLTFMRQRNMRCSPPDLRRLRYHCWLSNLQRRRRHRHRHCCCCCCHLVAVARSDLARPVWLRDPVCQWYRKRNPHE